MNYKKLISVSFATLLLANTGTAVVATATTNVSDESIDEEVLKSIFETSVDFNTVRIMNEVKKEAVEEEKQEEKERLEETPTPTTEEVVEDKNVEKSSENTIDENTSKDATKESQVINEKSKEDSSSGNLDTNDLSTKKTESEIEGDWGTCRWEFDLTNNQYRIYSGTVDYDEAAPWLRANAVITQSNIQNVSVVFNDGVIFQDGGYASIVYQEYLQFFGHWKQDENSASAAREKIKSIKFGKVDTRSSMLSMSGLFQGATGLESIEGLSNFDTSNIQEMAGMFKGCSSIKTFDLSNWDTSKVSDTREMFANASSLETVDISNWTVNIYSMQAMFQNTEKLKTLKMNHVSVLNDYKQPLRIMGDGIFKYLTDLTTLEVKGWNLTEIYDISNLYRDLFVSLPNITNLDLSDWKTSNVINMNSLFSGVTELESINLSGWDTSNVIEMNYMFDGCTNLKGVNISDWDTSNVIEMNYMFRSSGIEELALSDWDTSEVREAHGMFMNAISLETVDISNWTFEMDSREMFQNTEKLKTLKMNNISVIGEDRLDEMGNNIFKYMTPNLTKLEVNRWDVSSVENLSNLYRRLFISLPSIPHLELIEWVASSALDISGMFKDVGELKSLNLSGWKINNSLQKMNDLFNGADRLESLDISGWRFNYTVVNMTNNMRDLFLNTKKLTTLKMNYIRTNDTLSKMGSAIFQHIPGLTTLEAVGWDTRSVVNYHDLYKNIFVSLPNITHLDLSDWKLNTRAIEVSGITRAFQGADKLESINLSNWNIEGVRMIDEMFSGGKSLKAIDLSGWKIEKSVSMKDMFKEVTELEKLTLGDDMRFNLEAGLSEPASPKKDYVSDWTREDGNSGLYKPKDFMENFGTGDLKGGTYVASEVVVPYTLSNFKSDSVTIGETSSISFDVDLADELEEELFTDGKMSLSVIGETLPEEIEYEKVEVGYVNAQGKLIEIKSKRYDKEHNTIHFDIEKSTLDFTKKIRIILTGTAWNNTTDPTNNTKFLVDFNTDEIELNMSGDWIKTIGGQTQIANGTLGFSSIPNLLAFKPTKLIVTTKEILVDRLVPDWGVQISDYRGTNEISSTDESIARKDWDLVATMDAFQDSKGKEISSSALGLVYINESGNREELSTTDAVAVEKHKVEKETPKENHTTNVSWKEDAGIKTVVKNRNALNSNEEYSASVNFELRVAP
ncbi:BspA family leucine-rich repeat surface protein [Enterococcus faecalis]|nr:BspA family leucine-rich repeat surface protein [Enterococcus faecalis]